jgi:hypothetical protein
MQNNKIKPLVCKQTCGQAVGFQGTDNRAEVNPADTGVFPVNIQIRQPVNHRSFFYK